MTLPVVGKLYKLKQDLIVYDESKVIGRSYSVHSTLIKAGSVVILTNFEDHTKGKDWIVFQITFLVGMKEHGRRVSKTLFYSTFEELP